MPETQANNPLHGITLEKMLTYCFAHYGWDGLFEQIPANCFNNNPSVKSSLNFLRKTPWARARLETVFLYLIRDGIDDKLWNVAIKK